MHDPELIRDKRAAILARLLAGEISETVAIVLLEGTGMREPEAKDVVRDCRAS